MKYVVVASDSYLSIKGLDHVIGSLHNGPRLGYCAYSKMVQIVVHASTMIQETASDDVMLER